MPHTTLKASLEEQRVWLNFLRPNGSLRAKSYIGNRIVQYAIDDGERCERDTTRKQDLDKMPMNTGKGPKLEGAQSICFAAET